MAEVLRKGAQIRRENERNELEKNINQKMDAEDINTIVKDLPNFGGIFDDFQLENVKILSLPVMLVINSKEHWISIFIGKEILEIMDSSGVIKDKKINQHLCRFLCAQMTGKKFHATPQLQTVDSSDCGKYATSFLTFKALTDQSLQSFASIFSKNFTQNAKIIQEIFYTIKKLQRIINNK